MAATTAIEWCDATWSPWLGCTAVSPGCDHCYAEGWAKRTGNPELWAGERRRTSPAYWQQPFKWERQAIADGRRRRVFPSLCDPFDNQVPTRWRDDFWHRIEQTPHLDWCLLTKRPQNIAAMLPDPRTGTRPWGDGWPNVWLGITGENQTEFDRRWPYLAATPAVLRWLSYEPALGPLRLWPGVEWVICGGESGPGARPMHPDWARSVRDQCAAADVAFFFKQWGEFSPIDQHEAGEHRGCVRATITLRGHPSAHFCRVGKRTAGRLLDGREWSERPS